MSKDIEKVEIVEQEQKSESLEISNDLKQEFSLIAERFKPNDKGENAVMKVLQDNKQASFLKIKALSEAGLSIVNADYYIIPYGNEVKIEPSYKGLAKIATKEALKLGFNLIIKSDIISQSDKIEFRTENEIDNLSVSKNPFDNSMIGAYALISVLKNGNLIYRKAEFLNAEQIEAIKNASPASKAKQSPYESFAGEMARKSAIRRAIKHLDYILTSDTLNQVINIDNENYEFSRQNLQALAKPNYNEKALKERLANVLKTYELTLEQQREFYKQKGLFNLEKLNALLENENELIQQINDFKNK